jgi:hypothetical protein
VSADLATAFRTAPRRLDPQGRWFRDVSVRTSSSSCGRSNQVTLQFDICLGFGETELSARIRWTGDVRVLVSLPHFVL